MFKKGVYLFLQNGDLYCSVFLLVTILTLTSIQVILRYVFSAPLPWGEEVTTHLLVWITFLGGAVVTRREEHIKVTFFVEWCPKKFLVWLFLIMDLMIVGFLVAILIGCIPVFQKLRLMLLPALQISMNWVFASVPISAAIMLLYYGHSIYKQVGSIIRGEEVPLTHRFH